LFYFPQNFLPWIQFSNDVAVKQAVANQPDVQDSCSLEQFVFIEFGCDSFYQIGEQDRARFLKRRPQPRSIGVSGNRQSISWTTAALNETPVSPRLKDAGKKSRIFALDSSQPTHDFDPIIVFD
jgi:hypothetical protein